MRHVLALALVVIVLHSAQGEAIRILECPGPKALRMRLDDSMVDLDEEVAEEGNDP